MTSISFNKQVSMATAASHAAEVSGLRHSLERAEGELGQVKKQLEDNQVCKNLVYLAQMNKCA